MRSFSAALVVLLLTSASTARGRERVAVASFKMIGAEIQDPTRQAQARTSLVGGLAASDLEVVPAVEVQGALAGAPELATHVPTLDAKAIVDAYRIWDTDVGARKTK